MPKHQHYNFPVQNLATFKKHVLAFPARPSEEEEKWELNQDVPGFPSLIRTMKQYVKSILSHENDGAFRADATPQEVERECLSMMAKALRQFMSDPEESHVKYELPYHPRAGVTEWKWVLIYNEVLYPQRRTPAPSPGGFTGMIMGTQGGMGQPQDDYLDPIAVLLEEVAPRAGKGPEEINTDDEVDDLFSGKGGGWGGNRSRY
jgi:hypothetical protein